MSGELAVSCPETVTPEVVEHALTPNALRWRLEREVERAFEPRDWRREWDVERERSYALTMIRHTRNALMALHYLDNLRVSVAARGYGTSTGLGARLATIAVNFAVVADEATRLDVRRRIAMQDVW